MQLKDTRKLCIAFYFSTFVVASCKTISPKSSGLTQPTGESDQILPIDGGVKFDQMTSFYLLPKLTQFELLALYSLNVVAVRPDKIETTIPVGVTWSFSPEGLVHYSPKTGRMIPIKTGNVEIKARFFEKEIKQTYTIVNSKKTGELSAIKNIQISTSSPRRIDFKWESVKKSEVFWSVSTENYTDCEKNYTTTHKALKGQGDDTNMFFRISPYARNDYWFENLEPSTDYFVQACSVERLPIAEDLVVYRFSKPTKIKFTTPSKATSP